MNEPVCQNDEERLRLLSYNHERELTELRKQLYIWKEETKRAMSSHGFGLLEQSVTARLKKHKEYKNV